MSKRRNPTIAEDFAILNQMQVRENADRERKLAELDARLDGPVSRRELLDALDEMRGRASNDAEYAAAIMLGKLRELLS